MGITSKIKRALVRFFYTDATRENIQEEIYKIEGGARSNLPKKRVAQIEKWLETGHLRRAILDQSGRLRGATRKYCLKYGPRDFVKQGFRRK